LYVAHLGGFESRGNLHRIVEPTFNSNEIRGKDVVEEKELSKA
jgi:hypothetical protein